MKKLLSILLVALMLFVVSCDNGTPQPEGVPSTDTPSNSQPITEAALGSVSSLIQSIAQSIPTDETSPLPFSRIEIPSFSVSGSGYMGSTKLFDATISMSSEMETSSTYKIVSVPASISTTTLKAGVTVTQSEADNGSPIYTIGNNVYDYNSTVADELTAILECVTRNDVDAQISVKLVDYTIGTSHYDLTIGANIDGSLETVYSEPDYTLQTISFSGAAAISAVSDAPISGVTGIRLSASAPKTVTIDLKTINDEASALKAFSVIPTIYLEVTGGDANGTWSIGSDVSAQMIVDYMQSSAY